VDNVLEGSVRRAGNKLRITAQLIKVEDDTHLWSESYNRELIDVFDIQEEISQAIVKKLKVKLLGMEAECLVKDYTKNTEAYELFLKAMFYFNKGLSGHQKAIEFFEKAIKADPKYAPAYAHLAETYSAMGAAQSLPSYEVYPKIKALLQKLFEIDDKHAYVGMGIMKMVEYDWQGAESDFKRALELNPGRAESHHGYAVYLSALGRLDKAIENEERVLELDPLSSWYRFWLGWYECCSCHFDKAIEISQETLEFDPNNPWVSSVLGRAYGGKKLYDKGISILQRFEDVPYFAAVLGYLYGMAGNREKAKETVNSFLARSRKGYFSPYMIALVYAGLDEKGKVFDLLNSAFEVGDLCQIWLKVDIAFHSLHSEPRWAEQMKKRGLAD
jgi:tetratricopeptide (TPR) repeat protein